jgi:hypothetical protein
VATVVVQWPALKIGTLAHDLEIGVTIRKEAHDLEIGKQPQDFEEKRPRRLKGRTPRL